MIGIDERLDRASSAVRTQVNRIPVRPPAHLVRRQRRLRNTTFASGLTALILVVAAPAVLLNDPPPGTDAPTVPVVAATPPIVQGVAGPEPLFDTSDLGTSQPLTTLSDSTRINSIAEKVDGNVLQVTVLGQTPEGAAALIVHAELERDTGLIQERCFMTKDGGGCAGDSANTAAENPDGLLPPGLLTQGLVYGIVGDQGVLAWEVPEDTSVVVLTINETSTWQTPISRVAVFDTDLRDGDTIELTALNRNGDTLDTYRETARNESDPNGAPMTQPDN